MIAASITPRREYSTAKGARMPIINKNPRPCVICGTLFWNESFHRNRISGTKIRKTCGIGCRYKLAQISTLAKRNEQIFS